MKEEELSNKEEPTEQPDCSTSDAEPPESETDLPPESEFQEASEDMPRVEESNEETTEEEASPESSSLVSSVMEALLFTSHKPLSAKEIQAMCKGAAAAASSHPDAVALGKIREPAIRSAMEELARIYAETGRSFDIRESAAGWQFMTRPDFAPWLRQLFPENRSAKISAPAMETLAIIAYRQPLTRADIEAVRGVAVDGVMQTLLDRGLVKIAGRAEVPGRPLLYETTRFFLEHFGLKDLTELPNAGELRNIPLPISKETPSPAVAENQPASETAEKVPEIEQEESKEMAEPDSENSEQIQAAEELIEEKPNE